MADAGKLTIVTGFFDCGRGTHRQTRSNDKYFEYFRFWARIQNDVVVFGDQQTTDRALAIRREFDREAQTKAVVVENLMQCEPNLYAAMKRIEECGEFRKWRVRDWDISNEALYDYIMFMKFWMMRETARRYPDSGTLVWMDFGFNHGGRCYTNSKEFNFLWEYEVTADKVHLYAKGNVEKELGYMKLMLMTDGIMGCPFLLNTRLTEQLYDVVLESIYSLISLDLIDDDQMCLTMAWKRHPEMFEIHQSDWFMPIKECGGKHLSIRIPQRKKSVIDHMKGKSINYIIKYCYVRFLSHTTIERFDYMKRLSQLIKKYK